MRTVQRRITGLVVGASYALLCGLPAYADDTEIYTQPVVPVGTEIRPNILLIVDTSRSMEAEDVEGERETYDPNETYAAAGNCSAGRIFFRASGEPIPDCSSPNYIERDASHCAKLTAAVDSLSGRWTGKVAQWDDTSQTWRNLRADAPTAEVECASDSGVHGSNASPTPAVYAQDGSDANKWSSNAEDEIDWSQRQSYTFYSANWLNWRRVTPATTKLTRLRAVQNAVIDLVSSLDGVNVGMMRFNTASETPGEDSPNGGLVTNAIADIDAARADLISQVNSFVPESFTPLAETMYEATLYWAGRPVLYGGGSVADAKETGPGGTRYKSPLTHQCQRNFMVLLTDGRPARDLATDDEIASLIGGSCEQDNYGDEGTTDGQCADDLAAWLASPTTDLSSTLAGEQNVTTYTIGFGRDTAGAEFLTEIANAGGGRRFDAANSEELAEAFAEITSEILNLGSTFTTVNLGVSAFNQANSRNDVYFAVFEPSDRLRWEGNLKKYQLQVQGSGASARLIIADQSGREAIDPSTGFFRSTALSFWSSPPADGGRVTAGGAANELPDARNVYTYLGSNPAGSAASLVRIDDDAVTAAVLGADANVTRDQILAFALGLNGKRMGDPLHSEPAVVTYGGTEEAPDDYIFLATNDGYLHAFDADTGREQWAFVPKELLRRLKDLLINPAASSRTYGLDGKVRVLRLDRDNDGTIEVGDGDRVWLYVGMRRGGSHYYALDVTIPNSPKLLWSIGPAELPGVGETWSAPTIARVDVQGIAQQNNQDLVLIFGGGYDGRQENYTQTDDAVGNRIFMVDAKTGELLWYAGAHSGDDEIPQASRFLNVPQMRNSIPSDVTVLDIDGDLYADRMYVGDMGGRIFRFDIFSGDPPATLVAGGVFAELGQGGVAAPSIQHTRRFYNAPDVALIQRRGEDPYYNIAIGSGYRGHPLHTETIDRFYSLRDKQPFTKLRDYSGLVPITDNSTDLEDITDDPAAGAVPATKRGWKLVLSGQGEKVLAPSITVNNVVLFTTYEPTAASANPCRASSLNRVYALRVDTGAPALDLDRSGEITNTDLYEERAHDGILGGVNVGLLRGELAEALGEAPGVGRTVCLAGMHVLGQCVQVSDTVRTFWSRETDRRDD